MPARGTATAAALILAIVAVATSGTTADPVTLPKLNTLTSHVFTHPYGGGNYSTAALFLSPMSYSLNDPELLLNGFSGSSYFEVATAGDDFGFLSNMSDPRVSGITDVADVTAQDIYSPKEFQWHTSLPAEVGTVYGVVRGAELCHSVFTFQVDAINATGTYIRYATKLYTWVDSSASNSCLQASEGFGWEFGNKDGPGDPFKPTKPTPVLNTLLSFDLLKPYGCQGNYSTSAIWLSPSTKAINDPDGLYSGACGSTPYIDAATAGADFGMSTDLTMQASNAASGGTLDIHDVTMEDLTDADGWTSETDLVTGHVYAVWHVTNYGMSWYTFVVDDLASNGHMAMRLAVKDYYAYDYNAMGCVNQSPGFDWSAKNHV